MLSVHTCPLAMLGGKKTGGMNVYVRDFSRELAKKGIEVDVFDTQGEALEEPQACTVHQERHEPVRSMQLVQDRLDFTATQYNGQSVRLLRTYYIVEPGGSRLRTRL